MIAITGAVGAAAVALGTVVAIAPETPATTAVSHRAAPVVDRAAVVRTAEASLTDLEAQADAAGAAAQRADEAVLQDDTAANRAAADAAQAALRTLADRQTPELTRLVSSLTAAGVATAAVGSATSGGATVTTAALVGRTRALRAVSYAKQQIGDPYGFAAAGPGRWDCSGLTMKSYSAVKVGVGGHSATAQWRKAKAEHRLHLYKHRKVGDLIFYGAPGAVYHVAIYAGHNRMIEAPYPGKTVREVPVRSSGRLPNVGRPA